MMKQCRRPRKRRRKKNIKGAAE